MRLPNRYVAASLLFPSSSGLLTSGRNLHERRQKRVLGICLGLISKSTRYGWVGELYHGLDVWMRHRVELLVFELVVGPNIDVSTLILR